MDVGHLPGIFQAASPSNVRCSTDPDPLLLSGHQTTKIFPDSANQPIPGCDTIPIQERVIHGVRNSLTQISFLRRYHPGIDVPSRLLASTILDDAQTMLKLEDDGSDLTQCTTTVLTYQPTATLLILCVGGSNRNQLCTCHADSVVSEMSHSGQAFAFGEPLYAASAPIVQVQSMPGHRVFLRTRQTATIGQLHHKVGINEHPIYRFSAQSNTTKNKSPLAGACLRSDSSALLVNTQGAVRLWDIQAQKR